MSGHNYPEWKGTFYPADLPTAKMLPYYAARFPTVEVNYTFYRMPTEKLVGGWAAQTPSPYKLTLKAPRRITHDSRLKNCGALVATLCQVAGTLGEKLGALLFQLPPSSKKDLAVFDAFLDELPPKAAAFEFRHQSCRRGRVERSRSGIWRCVSPTARRCRRLSASPPTTYFRLRDEGYTPDDVKKWAARSRARPLPAAMSSSIQARGRRKGPEFAPAAEYLQNA